MRRLLRLCRRQWHADWRSPHGRYLGHDTGSLVMSDPETFTETCPETLAIIEAAYSLSQESGLSYLCCLAIVEARWNA